jgi:hypothetical protein
MRNPLQQLRERFHPLYYARKSAMGRFAIRLADKPVWLSVSGISFKVRGRLVTHGLAFAASLQAQICSPRRFLNKMIA